MTMPGTLIVDRDIDLAGAERGTAWFSTDRAYRYLLTRRWDVLKPVLPWVMLNPSKADAFRPDPTITRVIGFARREGYGGIEIGNLRALRATDPRELAGHPDPTGPANDRILADLAWLSPVIVVAWGAHPASADRAAAVARIFAAAGVQLRCLGVTKDGHPKHPLARGRERVPDDAPLIPWKPPL